MEFTIALAGNPNSGKTTLFNALTGSNQYVGNWPGVTVERKEARFQVGDDMATLVDLPGVYSLSPYSIEENITRHFIAQHAPDVVVNIVDATNLERNLYFTLQLMELERPVVVALNLMDEVRKLGGSIDAQKISKQLGVPVVPISAKRKEGFDELFAAIHQQAHSPRSMSPVELYDESTRQAIGGILELLGGEDAHSVFDKAEHAPHRDENERDDDHPHDAPHKHVGGYEDEGDSDYAPPSRWVALKLLEGDDEILGSAELSDAQKQRLQKALDGYVERGQRVHPEIDAITLMVSARYDLIARVLDAAKFRRGQKVSPMSEKIDRVMTHKYLAFPIFVAILALMFWVTFGPVGNLLTGWMETLVEWMAGLVSAGLNAVESPDWATGLILDGVIAGVGGVLVFLPQILLIFLFMSVLEDSGYMARAAFVTDRVLRKFGLSGRSFIPMLMGFGCTTTAVIGARGVENERDRRMTIMLTPFMSCGAKLPVYGLFVAAFFPNHSMQVVLSLYLLGMAVMVISGVILRKTVFREGDTPFVMELPPYRMPTVVNVARRMWDRAKDFLTRAGTVIFAMSVVIWFLQNFSPSLTMVSDSADSIFGHLGAFIAPIFAPLGFGQWEKCVALLSGLVAKEAVVSTMQVLYSAADTGVLAATLASQFTPLSAVSFLVFVLLYTPCVSAIAAIRREMNSAKYTVMAIAMQLGTAYVVSLLVYQAGRLLGF